VSVPAGPPQALPSYTAALPNGPTATQNDADTHDTDLNPDSPPPSLLALHELPL
jgi:hypothetical protein